MGQGSSGTPAAKGLPDADALLAARQWFLGLNFFERNAAIDLLTDVDLLVLAAAPPADVDAVERLLKGFFPTRLEALHAGLAGFDPQVGVDDPAAVVSRLRAVRDHLARTVMTREQAKALDGLTDMLLCLEGEELEETVVQLSEVCMAVMVVRSGGVEGRLGRHISQRECSWDLIEFWIPAVSYGQLPQAEVDDWLEAAAKKLPGFAWVRSTPAKPTLSDGPAYEGWLALGTNGREPLPLRLPPGFFAFADLARLEREDVMALLRNETQARIALAMPRDPEDPARAALLSCMSEALRAMVLADAQSLGPTWALRARAQEEVAAHARALEAQGALWFPWSGKPRPAAACAPREAALPATPVAPGSDEEALAMLLAEAHALRRTVCDMPLRDLRALLQEVSNLDLEAVAGAAPLDRAFLGHLEKALAERAWQMLWRDIRDREPGSLPAGQLRAALDVFRAAMDALASGRAAEGAEDREQAERPGAGGLLGRLGRAVKGWLQ